MSGSSIYFSIFILITPLEILFVLFLFFITVGLIELIYDIIDVWRDKKIRESKARQTALPEIEIPKSMDWKEPSDYQPGIYTLTFDNVEFFETRNGIYRHYIVGDTPANYPKPVPSEPKSYNQIWDEYELEGELGIHSPSSSV